MELEDIRSEWQSVKPHITPHLNGEMVNRSVLNRNDVKTRLLKRFVWEYVFTIVCTLLMATSRLWAPMKLPYWWLGLFCVVLLSALLYILRMYSTIKKLNLWKNTNIEIMSTVISVKKLYRNIELMTLMVIIPLMLWISFSPSFINSWRMFFVWGLSSLALCLEFLWYRSSMKHFNNLIYFKNK